ncbi:MAG: hypothetical protein A2W76_05380 [Gammaproteobacteria bacterium RIFCSPLOWO2_12_47_11]|nr:MAG: hypothetical protein A2W76_05380 [Gammaproteobacteria bacterium RIFCSPLOWO2_12_47_11]
MRKITFYLGGILIAGTVLAVSGCAVYPAHPHQGYGPPPHAPAHGYRAKYHDHDLVYDSHLGVYLVIGLQDHYYRDGYYYRYARDGWYHSRYIDRDWGRYDDRKLPPGLAKKYGGNGKGKGKENRD